MPGAISNDWIRAKVEDLKGEVKEAKEIGVEARRIASNPHECRQTHIIEGIREKQMSIIEELGNWKFFKKLFFVLMGIIASLVIFSITAFVNSTSTIEETTSNVSNNVRELAHKHDKLVDRVENLSKVQYNVDREQARMQLLEIRKAIKEELEMYN